tara:strand:+ start:371 stop:748 length:378 start_codon:yes stop_codon:yes gene_type:complete
MNRKELLPWHQIKHLHEEPQKNPETFHRIDIDKAKKTLGRPKGSKTKYSFSKFKKLDYELLINYLWIKGECMEYHGITYSKKIFSSLYQDDVSFHLDGCDDYEELKKKTLENLCPMIREYVKLRH